MLVVLVLGIWLFPVGCPKGIILIEVKLSNHQNALMRVSPETFSSYLLSLTGQLLESNKTFTLIFLFTVKSMHIKAHRVRVGGRENG